MSPLESALCVAVAFLLFGLCALYLEVRDLRKQTETYIRWSVHVSAMTGIPTPDNQEDKDDAERPER